ncbi:MAG: hypothetical protein LBV44_00015 [Methylobacillus sp.]|jgi:hypothetical protein|nr:hypothetical protein [Methylobacillus sp.]
MKKFFAHAGIAVVALVIGAPVLAYDCNESEAYRKGWHELDLIRQVSTAQLGTAVEFIQKQDGTDVNTALKKIMRMALPEETKLYDEQLARLRAQIKSAPTDSPQACDALLTLQLQYTYTGQQKIDFITKHVTGENSAPDLPQ